ncbi:RNA-binding S4 domain-containing protein [Rhodobacteraceae bacterium XHP0102]|nr:RNA-binding S4 domain-containing protein [Rhodobacteraceae bacterium XHP0102]
MNVARATMRLDKWLWFARFFKTRSLATRMVEEGAIRVNANRVSKPATLVGAGDVLTFAQGRAVRVVRIAALPTRRGPPSEAQEAYTDLSEVKDTILETVSDKGQKRPDKRERRQAISLRHGALE